MNRDWKTIRKDPQNLGLIVQKLHKIDKILAVQRNKENSKLEMKEEILQLIPEIHGISSMVILNKQCNESNQSG